MSLSTTARKAFLHGWLFSQGNVLRLLRELRRWQGLDRSESESLQQRHLESLLRHAHDHVPYYRGILRDADVVSGDGRIHPDRLSRLPLLDKPAIRTHFEKLKSDDLASRRWYYNISGGSTAEPLRFIQDGAFKARGRAGSVFTDLWAGYRPGDPRVLLWGAPRDVQSGTVGIRAKIKNFVRNEIWLNSYWMDEKDMSAYAERINFMRPRQILAYAESVYDLARFIERTGQSVFSPTAIVSSSGTLYPGMRATVERVFGAPVFNRYGSREILNIAFECDSHEGMHVITPYHYVEIIRPDGSPAPPGETGEIVITSLTNYAMPFIRYRIGDLGSWSPRPCSCGRSWPLLAEVTGRTAEIFVRRDGRHVLSTFFGYVMFFQEWRDWIDRCQFVQEDYDLIRVLIRALPGKKINKAALPRIAGQIKEVMGDDCRVEFEFVAEIPPVASGKIRTAISKVSGKKTVAGCNQVVPTPGVDL